MVLRYMLSPQRLNFLHGQYVLFTRTDICALVGGRWFLLMSYRIVKQCGRHFYNFVSGSVINIHKSLNLSIILIESLAFSNVIRFDFPHC